MWTVTYLNSGPMAQPNGSRQPGSARPPPGKKITIRVPLIRGFNADEASVTAITNFAADELGVHDIHFLPYHTLGMNKYTLLGQPYSAPDKPLDNPALLDFAQQYACQKGLTATLRG